MLRMGITIGTAPTTKFGRTACFKIHLKSKIKVKKKGLMNDKNTIVVQVVQRKKNERKK
jgi:hypothetical protein